MLTTIPYKEFLELTKGVSEENNASKKPFVWADMLKHAKKEKDIQTYVSKTNCKFVGEGSSRIAYFIPPGLKTSKEVLNCPSCFKVAKKDAGVAQNEAEITLINNYGDDYDCFPKLYDYDDKHKFFLLCEVGTPFSDVPREVVTNFFSKWNKWAEEHYPEKKFLIMDETRSAMNTFPCLMEIILRPLMHRDKEDRMEAIKIVTMIHDIAKNNSEYKTISDFLKSLLSGGLIHDLELMDFRRKENWGLVNRDGKLALIPIDWGFTKEVAEEYYW